MNTDSEVNLEVSERPIEGHRRPSISSETQAQQGLQDPSGGISGNSSVTPQGVSKELGIKSEVGDRQSPTALDELVGSAPPQEEKKKANSNSLDKKSQIEESRENPIPKKDFPVPLEKTILYNNLSTEAIKITNAKNLDIEAEQKTEEYLNASKETLARIRANLAKKQERMDAERRAKDWEASPMSLLDSQNVEELKREQEQEAERFLSESLRNGRIINRPAPEEYLDDW